MQVYPTISMKTKGEKKEHGVSPTMLMKTSMLSVLSNDVYENKGDDEKVSGARCRVSGAEYQGSGVRCQVSGSRNESRARAIADAAGAPQC